MKSIKLTSTVIFLFLSSAAYSQSGSFQTLKDNFIHFEDVHSFSINGFLCRTALWMTDEWEFKDAIRDVKSIHIITIPRHYFEEAKLSVEGFRRYIEKDNFENLATLRDNGDNVEIYLRQAGRKKDCYLVLVEDVSDVTVIELKAYIDVEKLKENNKLSYSSR